MKQYPLIEAIKHRRSRRFGMGMAIPEGPLTYQSQHPPTRLTEAEEAAMVFAGVGITSRGLADLSYGKGQGGNMLAGLVGRTVASPDAVSAVSLAVTNDKATYFIKRPQNFSPDDIATLIKLGETDQFLDIYQKMRVKLKDGRTTAPVIPGDNFNINKWSLYADGGTYFVPINDISSNVINACLSMFEPSMGLFVIDERRMFQPAGLRKFAKSKGGHLDDNPRNNTVVTVQGFEMSMCEAVAVEQGMVLHNLGLMGQALGLGGFANFARSEYAWFEALGFRLEEMPASCYGGARPIITKILSLFNMDAQYQLVQGLEKNGEQLLKPFCPPYYKNMEEAVYALVEWKFGRDGVYRARSRNADWKDPKAVGSQIGGPSQLAIDATVAYCTYLYKRYSRFPGYSAPYRTVIGYQATVVDTDFYDKFYHPTALTNKQRERSGK